MQNLDDYIDLAINKVRYAKTMAQVLCIRSLALSSSLRHPNSPNSTRCQLTESVHSAHINHSWNSLQRSLKCNPRFSCFFSDNNKQEQARKALESALGGKKTEFEKWDKEIRRREEAGGGGNSGGGGWFGWGGWFGGSNGDHFWQEAQQISLTILGIIAMYLIVAKGDVILAVIFNPLLFVLRGTRNGLTFLTSPISRKVNRASNTNFSTTPQEGVSPGISARENVVRKWGSD